MSDKPIRLGDALRKFLEESKVGERLGKRPSPEWAERVARGSRRRRRCGYRGARCRRGALQRMDDGCA